MDSNVYSQLQALATDSGMIGLLKRLAARYVSWQEFKELPMPAGLSAEATWDLLKRLSRATGIEFPIPDIEGLEYWYFRTHELSDSVSSIQCMCRADSALYRTLTTTQNRSVVVQSRIDETVAAALLDGLAISEEDAQALLQLDRTPRNDTERLVRNTLTALDDLEGLAEVPFSRELFWHLRYLLMEGVDVRRIKRTKPRMGLMTSDYSEEQVRQAGDRQLGFISAYMNYAAGDPYDHPVIRALLIPDMFRFYRPLPDSNSEVGRLAFRLFALKVGLPVLGMLPLSRAKLDWEDDLLDSERVMRKATYLDSREKDGADLTGWATLAVQLTLKSLGDLNWQLTQLQKRDEELRALLQQDPEINHRQRSILGRALRDPAAEFRIAFHKNQHNVVYATARSDLLELADKGFLGITKKGRAMVFTPREKLREFIEELYGEK